MPDLTPCLLRVVAGIVLLGLLADGEAAVATPDAAPKILVMTSRTIEVVNPSENDQVELARNHVVDEFRVGLHMGLPGNPNACSHIPDVWSVDVGASFLA